MTRIAIDPVTRIEGHLRIEALVEGGRVREAWSAGTMFRGIELILRDRDPREAWIWAQRICGVCTTVHALASVRAVEDALDIEIPPNAELVRTLIAVSQTVHDHVIHFYHLHALDWVDVTSALRASPEATSRLAQSISDWPLSSTDYFRGVQQRLKRVVDSGQLSLLASGYWGHPAYRLEPAANLLAFAHYLEALEWQRDVIRIHAVLGGKNPHPQTYVVGGMASPLDPSSPQAINGERIAFIRERIQTMTRFVDQVYIPDVLAIAAAYREWADLGAGPRNYLSYGGPPLGRLGEDRFLFPRGVLLRGQTRPQPVDPGKVTEEVARSWFRYRDDGAALQPLQGETDPDYTGPDPPYEFLDTDAKYSWLKSPRYDGQVMEVGPLARVVMAYVTGEETVVPLVDRVLRQLSLRPEQLHSTLGRVAARAIETKVLADRMEGWLDELAGNMGGGDLRSADTTRWDPDTWPDTAEGFGFHEAPRGSLGHWVQIRDKKIANYQAVVPTTWNAGPRDGEGRPGPYELALVGTPVADEENPLELLRTVHSFDPCMACAVHVLGGGEARGGIVLCLGGA